MLSGSPTTIEKPRTKVSVILLTFNHEKWISQSIESVLTQETEFDYELVIVEDCSTDKTRDIVVNFQRMYPERIRLSLSDKNGEYRTNFAKTYLAAPSQYVVRMDGDDYFTSPHKLQKQVEFLDSNPECALCFHNVEVFYEDSDRTPWLRNPHTQAKITTLEDLLSECFISGPSAMLRKGLFTDFPDWYYTAPSGDWPLYILSAQHGNIGYIDEVMGAYRIHSQGMWSKLNELQRLETLMKFYVSLSAYLGGEYEEVIKRTVSIHCNYYTREYCRQLQEASNKRLKELESTLETERLRSKRRHKQIRNLKIRLDNLEGQPQRTWGSHSRRVARGVNRIKGWLWGR